jgi:hypothetical protein
MITHTDSLQNMMCKLAEVLRLSVICRGVENLWYKSNLSNQKQCIEINYTESTTQVSGTYSSDLKEIKHNGPQG